MQNIKSGEILGVFSDDNASSEGVPAWCRLTGNKLLHEQKVDREKTAFYIQKKNN
jgi:TusA-related sulfurtransferase